MAVAQFNSDVDSCQYSRLGQDRLINFAPELFGLISDKICILNVHVLVIKNICLRFLPL